jgi:hypothetical protein
LPLRPRRLGCKYTFIVNILLVYFVVDEIPIEGTGQWDKIKDVPLFITRHARELTNTQVICGGLAALITGE